MLVFGLGLAVTVAPLTATALSSAPGEHAGLASAVNNDVARIGGLVAVAVLPALSGISGAAYLHPTALAGGFRTATLIAGAWCVAGGVLAAVGIRNPPRAAACPRCRAAPPSRRPAPLRTRRPAAGDHQVAAPVGILSIPPGARRARFGAAVR